MSSAGSTAESMPAIPYREAAEVSGSEIASAFGAAILLLALAIALAWLARRLGWLRHWGVGAGPAMSTAAAGLRVEQTLRISPRTMLFRIADGEQRFLLAESREGVQWLALPPTTVAGQGSDDAR